MTARPPAAHLDALTGIRGIAAWAVVLYHIRLSMVALLPAPVIAALGKGYLAVDLFFMLSGFVIWYNYADRLRGGGAGETRLFLWRRFARVWPLHAAILTAALAFALLLLATGRDAANFPLAELPLHYALVQNWGFTPALTWNHPAWSISTEAAAYLLFPLLVCAARWERLPPWALLAVIAALMVALHLLFALTGHALLGDAIERLGLARCLIGFTIGCLLCLVWLHWRDRQGMGTICSLGAAAALGAGLGLNLPETAFVPAVFAALLLALALGKGLAMRALAARPLVYLGEISYSTYLAHFLLFVVWKIVFVDATLQLGWAGLAGFLALVLAASVGLYHGLEKPAQRWLNARPPRWAARPAALPAE